MAIKGLSETLANLQKHADKARKEWRVEVIVGFSQWYAIYPHEDLEAYHPVGQAKYLEQPFRELAPEAPEFVATAIRAGKTPEEGLLLLGLRLQREAQLLTPVDTGALRASAFTRKV